MVWRCCAGVMAVWARHLGSEAGPAEEGEALVQRGRQHARQDLVHRLQRVVQDALGARHQDLRMRRTHSFRNMLCSDVHSAIPRPAKKFKN